jgi:hypothetical protein
MTNLNQFNERMKIRICFLIIAAGLGHDLRLRADVLELKNGTVQNGRYMGGTSNSVRFVTSSGAKDIDTSRIAELKFASSDSDPLSPTGALPQPTTITNVVLQAGTTLLVRMIDSVSSQNSAGTPFSTRLEYDLGPTGGVAVVKGGTTIFGRVANSAPARRVAGQSTLDLRLTEMVVNGKRVPIATSGFNEAGPAPINKAAKGAMGGAMTNAIIRGTNVTIPPGALLEFTLVQPVTLQSAH